MRAREVVTQDTDEHGADILAYRGPRIADRFRRAVLDVLTRLEGATRAQAPTAAADHILMRWLALLAIATVVLGRAWRRWRRAAARQRRLMLLCQRAGLAFAPLDLNADTAWLPFRIFGHPRHGTENIVWDELRGPAIRAFDYWYQDPADDRTVAPRRRLTCAVAPLGASAPRLRIVPRGLADDVMGMVGAREVRLELEDFNRRFLVESADERFAIAFLEQRMMEALLAMPDVASVEVNEDVILLWASELPAEQVLVLFDAAVAIHRRLPRVVRSLFPPRPARGPHEDRWLQGGWSTEPTEGAVREPRAPGAVEGKNPGSK